MAKAKITITGSGKSDAYTPYAFLYINNTVYTSAQVVEVELGTVCQCRVGRGTTGVVAILLDGNPVKEVTDTYGEAIYELTVNRNYTIELGVATGATINITTGAEVASDDIHNSLISGTAREIESGTALIGGVLREIESGLVLVNGVAREIAFKVEPRTFNVTISGSTQPTRAKVEINGVEYSSAARLVVESGTELIAYAMSSANGRYTTQVNLNGTRVLTSSSGSWFDTYTHVIESDVEVELNSGNTMTINITTS